MLSIGKLWLVLLPLPSCSSPVCPPPCFIIILQCPWWRKSRHTQKWKRFCRHLAQPQSVAWFFSPISCWILPGRTCSGSPKQPDLSLLGHPSLYSVKIFPCACLVCVVSSPIYQHCTKIDLSLDLPDRTYGIREMKIQIPALLQNFSMPLNTLLKFSSFFFFLMRKMGLMMSTI